MTMNTPTSTIVNQPAVQQLIMQIEIFLRDVWRYRWASIITAWVLALAGWGIVFVIPDKYEASAKVFVDTDSILRPLLKGLAVESNLQSKLQLMTRTLLSRPNLEKVLRATDMDLDALDKREKEKLLGSLRRHIDVSATRKNNLYTLSFEHEDPKRAKAVVQKLLTILVETTLSDTRLDSNVARKFIGQQIKEYESRLVEAEQRLMEFKRKNVGLMPGQGQDYFGKLQNTQDQLEQARFELTQAQKKRDELNKQIKEMVSMASNSTSSSIKTSIDSRIQALKIKLDDLKLKYTNEHPDVKELENTIVGLEQQKQNELKSMAAGESSSEAMDSSPVYRDFKIALGTASGEVATATVRVNEYQRRLKDLQQRMGSLPKIEAELISLNRDYTINKSQYDQLLSRSASAKMSEDADSAGDQVKFQIIEPPHVPSVPSSPNRPMLSTIVLIFSIAGAFGLAFLFSQFHPVIYDQKTLREVTGYPVFGTISMFRNPEVLQQRKHDLIVYAGSLGMLCVIYVTVLAVDLLIQ